MRCDGVSRRSFLQIGGFTFGATCLSLPQILRAQGANSTSSHKAIINVAGSGRFSSDRTIAEYAADIWHATPCPVP